MEFPLDEMEELDDLLGNKDMDMDSFTLTRNCLGYFQRAFVSLEDVSIALKGLEQ
jgi:hypothetical protein